MAAGALRTYKSCLEFPNQLPEPVCANSDTEHAHRPAAPDFRRVVCRSRSSKWCTLPRRSVREMESVERWDALVRQA
jgi:hypothetical protein